MRVVLVSVFKLFLKVVGKASTDVLGHMSPDYGDLAFGFTWAVRRYGDCELEEPGHILPTPSWLKPRGYCRSVAQVEP